MRKIRLATAIVLLASLAACAGGPGRPGERGAYRDLRPVAHPSEVITTELAFARMAREKGTWTAFREYSTNDALMASPGFVNAHQALKGEADPAEPIVWGPDHVWSSCDGSFAVSTGGAQYPSGRKARFVSVWQRQKNGDYRWVLDQGVPDDEAVVSPETIGAEVADCPAGPPPRKLDIRSGEDWSSAVSNDGTLAWETQIASDCSRTVVVRMRRGEAMTEVFRRSAPAPQTAAGQAPPSCG